MPCNLLLDGYVQLPNNTDAVVMDMRFDTKENTFKETAVFITCCLYQRFCSGRGRWKIDL